MDHFKDIVAFISDGLSREGCKVLVHCAAGISRSATMIISYLVAEEQLGWKEGLHLCRQARPVVCPNPAFRKQLEEWEQLCRRRPIDQF